METYRIRSLMCPLGCLIVDVRCSTATNHIRNAQAEYDMVDPAPLRTPLACWWEQSEYNDKVILDFDGVNYALTAFLNPVFSKLIVEYSNDVFKNIEIVNANEQIIKKIKMIKEDSLVKREDFFI